MTTAEIGALTAGYERAAMRAEAEFGPRSRALYFVTFMTTLAAFDGYARDLFDHGLPSSAAGPLFHRLLQRLDALFTILSSGTAPASRLVGMARIAGSSTPVYRYDAEVYRREMPGVAEAIAADVVTLDGTGPPELPSGLYLYCLAPSGALRVYARPLTAAEVLHGARAGEHTVKHPVLAEPDGLRVACAGELYVAAAGGRVIGAIGTRASGHYRPPAATAPALRASLQRVFRLPSERVFLVAE